VNVQTRSERTPHRRSTLRSPAVWHRQLAGAASLQEAATLEAAHDDDRLDQKGSDSGGRAREDALDKTAARAGGSISQPQDSRGIFPTSFLEGCKDALVAHKRKGCNGNSIAVCSWIILGGGRIRCGGWRSHGKNWAETIDWCNR
jgi:hypothetical protein